MCILSSWYYISFWDCLKKAVKFSMPTLVELSPILTSDKRDFNMWAGVHRISHLTRVSFGQCNLSMDIKKIGWINKNIKNCMFIVATKRKVYINNFHASMKVVWSVFRPLIFQCLARKKYKCHPCPTLCAIPPGIHRLWWLLHRSMLVTFFCMDKWFAPSETTPLRCCKLSATFAGFYCALMKSSAWNTYLSLRLPHVVFG